MSTGCLTCFKVMRLWKKQSKKEDKPLKAERLPEKFVEEEDENGADKKTPTINEPWIFTPCSRVDSNDPNWQEYSDKLHAGVSSSSLSNDFHKVKTFDLRGVTKTVAK
ncbi:unnamed protein product [Microthlaspi erraticum]|uniref:Uncharacterized protein n=1 Tax=Microthlaspi erraticum TaxID=1685480 RepID=A0A6D2LII9_9BRAS|nr:unnamed protein product [Microthlaspi erraticum]